MNMKAINHGWKVVVLLLFISGCERVYSQSGPPVIGQAPDFTLQTSGDKQQSFYQSRGKVRLVEFFYTKCPDICPMTTANMVKIQNKLKQERLFGNRVEFVSITFDPNHDTSEVLKKYADNLGADLSNWSFMRGSNEETKNTARQFHVFYELSKDGFVTHSINSLFLIDRNNNVRGVYKEGRQMPVNQIMNDIETLAQ